MSETPKRQLVVPTEPDRFAVYEAIRLVGGYSKAAEICGLPHREQVRRWLMEDMTYSKIKPEHARILSKACGYRVKVDEMCPEAYDKLSQKELSFPIRK